MTPLATGEAWCLKRRSWSGPWVGASCWRELGRRSHSLVQLSREMANLMDTTPGKMSPRP